MGIEERFNQAVKEWIEHCKSPDVQVDSSSELVRNCDAYRKIISIGKKALPLLRQLYDAKISSYSHVRDDKRGDVAIFPAKLAQERAFMDDLFKFQYGETAEESNEGFNQMMQRGKEKVEKDLPLSMIKNHGLASAVEELVGDDFSVPEEIRGQISKVEEYTKDWLDKNMHKYLSTE